MISVSLKIVGEHVEVAGSDEAAFHKKWNQILADRPSVAAAIEKEGFSVDSLIASALAFATKPIGH